MPLDEGDRLSVLLVLLPIVCLLVATVHTRIRLCAAARTSAAVVVIALAALSLGHPESVKAATLEGIHKVQHVVMIQQENRSMDSYFGTYPGANGLPAGVCVPDPLSGMCVAPYHNPRDENYGGPHDTNSTTKDIDGRKMDRFIKADEGNLTGGAFAPTSGCINAPERCDEVMGWHDAREIPNYWAYAKNFVLQDHMFEPNASWSLPSHLFMVSGWSAKCATPGDPTSCVNALDGPSGLNVSHNDYAWTDLTYLLHKSNVSWAYYLSEGIEPDCEDDSMDCPPKAGTLPAVSWIVPENRVSEHPPARVSEGQAYVTGIINAAMQSADWNSTA